MAGKRNPLNFWSPDHEKQFGTFMAFNPAVRQWRNAFQNAYGESPQIDADPSFNYRAAWLSGNAPSVVKGDTVPHWGSDGKAKDHPTAWKQSFMTTFGVDPDEVPGDAWTPEMRDFMTRELRGNFLMRSTKRGEP